MLRVSADVDGKTDARRWFTGPRITLDAEVLTEEQIKAVQEKGIKVEGDPTGQRMGSISKS